MVQTPLPSRPDWLTIPEAAALLGISRQAVHKLCDAMPTPIRWHQINGPDAQRRVLHLDTADVLALREQRAAQDKPVGLIPWPVEPSHPPEVPPVPELPAKIFGIGLPTFRPF
jgi:hypothetical protein